MLNSVNSLLVNIFGPLGPIIVMGAFGVALLVIAIPILMSQKPDPMEKIKRERLGQAHVSSGESSNLRHGGGKDALENYADFLEPQDVKEFTATQELLLQAGYRAKSAVRTFYFAQFALGIGLLFLGLIYTLLLAAEDTSSTNAALMTLGPGLVGYYLPRYWVNKRISARQGEIEEGFPDSLDLMLVCVEAGQGMDQAIIRVAEEIRPSFPALAEEYALVAYEIKAGKDKATVLRDMGDRSGVADVASFVTVLIQSQTFGTSVAEALKVYSVEMRDKRVMRAEEKANTLPTKLTLGTMMFTLPPLMIILIGPAIYSIYDTFSNGGIGVQ